MNEDFKIGDFKGIVEEIRHGTRSEKTAAILRLLVCNGLRCHITNNATGKGVYSISETFQYAHEYATAVKLTNENFNVIFVPNGYFEKGQKKFDVFLCRDHMLLEVDLKSLTSVLPNTIGEKIKKGSDQAPRLVLDVQSNIGKMDLIDGLRQGCERNDIIVQIYLFYKTKFYSLQKNQILSRNIFDIIP